MSISDILYTVILGPLELLFDMIFSIVYDEIGSAGLTLTVLSLVINLLILPLYRRADHIQEQERDQAKQLKPGIDKIKRVFKGDEQFLMLQTYYRQNHYKPWFALRSALPLLLQVPFFIAAYNYLSHLELLQDISFGPIPNLGRPDGMLTVFGITINILPVAMTLINIVSGAVYTHGMPLKSKIQLYGMALLFLILLYDSPSGLVFYWTLNNVFSLGKNLIQKTSDSRKTGRILWALSGIAFLLFFEIIHPVAGPVMKAIFAAAGLTMLFPLVRSLVLRKQASGPYNVGKASAVSKEINNPDEKTAKRIFWSSCFFLTILTGLLIPSTIIHESPGEFADVAHYLPPVSFLLNPTLTAAGLFLVWGGIFYQLSSPNAKRRFPTAFTCVAAAAMINYTLFGLDYGNLSSCLAYDYVIKVNMKDMITNAAAILLSCGAVLVLWKWRRILLQIICYAGCAATIIMSFLNISGIISETKEIEKSISAQQKKEVDLPSFTLDTEGKNVVFIMLDRAISGFIPYIFNEKPELTKAFDGFTYYPNTLSYGAFTNSATPAMFGGYEYTPLELGKRTEKTIREKHNEALKLMPAVFRSKGYDVTVCDPPYANYRTITDLSIYDDDPEIHAYKTIGVFGEQDPVRYANWDRLVRRNLFSYSLFRCSPVLFHWEMYDKGQYNDAAVKWSDKGVVYLAMSTDRASGIKQDFQNSYDVLVNLPSMTKISNNGSSHFMMIDNDTTHEPRLLQMPDYVPDNAIDNSLLETGRRTKPDGEELWLTEIVQIEHYHVNMSALLQIGKWLEYLKENRLYDNTRIIIASDHGRSIGLYSFIMDNVKTGSQPDDSMPDVMYFNPLLMVKDFDSHGCATDNSFMTNADVPTIAFSGLIENPTNPFTGKAITDTLKTSNEQFPVYMSFKLTDKNLPAFTDYTLIRMQGHYMFDPENWSYVK